MCFSAPASLAASAIITLAGVLAIRAAGKSKGRLLAAIPFLFGIQQAIEAALWLTASDDIFAAMQFPLVQIYAVFVGVVWPTLVPLSVIELEERGDRRHYMLIVLVLGSITAIYALALIGLYGFGVEFAEQGLIYTSPVTIWPWMTGVYIIGVCGAFLSSDRRLQGIGLANLLGFLVAYSFFHLSFPSVWCFFAAILSLLIYLYIRQDELGFETGVAELSDSANKPNDDA